MPVKSLVVHAANQEVLGLHAQTWVEFLEVRNYLSVFRFEEEDRCCVIKPDDFLSLDPADGALYSDMLLVVTNDQIIHNHARIITMDVACFWSTAAEVSFHAVASVEEFADISSNIVLQHVSTTWMEPDEFSDIEDKAIQNHELLSFANSFVELCLCD